MDSSQDRPALLNNADEISRSSLEKTVAAALNTRVMLADDALTKSSMLIIERNPPRSMQNAPAQGRVMEMPIRLQLMKNGDDCVLVDLENQERHVLDNATCIPE